MLNNSARSNISRLGISVLGVDHVGIAVRDLDPAVEFYTRTFGLELISEETNEEQGVREAMLAAGGHGPQIQLLAPLSDDSPLASFLERRGEGLQQLAYAVADVAQAGRTLSEAGLRVLYEEPRRGTAGSLINFVHPRDAGGVLVELVQRDPGST